MNSFFQWSYQDRIPYQESESELSFLNHLQVLIGERKINIAYSLDSGIYLIENLVSMFHVLPGPFLYNKNIPRTLDNREYLVNELKFPSSLFIEITSIEEIQQYLELSRNNLLLTCSEGSLPKEWLSIFDNLIIISHGVDEDYIYSIKDAKLEVDKPPEKWLSMVFTNFNRSICPYSSHDLIQRLGLNPNQQTILYVGTIGRTEEFFNIGKTPKFVWKSLLKEFNECRANGYNFIFRPHPMCTEETIQFLQNHGIPYLLPSQYPYFRPILELVDIVIGGSTGVTCAATYWKEKPILLIRRVKDLYKNNLSVKNLNLNLNQNDSKFVLSEDNTKVLNFKLIKKNKKLQLKWVDTLLDLVKSALSPSVANQIKSIRRGEYFQYWFGGVDGYEEYRQAILILKGNLKIPTQELEQLYLMFLPTLVGSSPPFDEKTLINPNSLEKYLSTHSYLRSDLLQKDREEVYFKIIRMLLNNHDNNTSYRKINKIKIMNYVSSISNSIIRKEVKEYLNHLLTLRKIDRYEFKSTHRKIIKNYLNTHKVYISLTTSPLRIKYVIWVLLSLDLKYVDMIYINLPDVMRGMFYDFIPDYLENFPKVKINNFGTDLGPISKVVPALELINDPKALIITVDDDTIYPFDLVNRLIKECIIYDCACGTSLKNIEKWEINPNYWIKETVIDPHFNVIEGCGSIVYKRKFIDIPNIKTQINKGIECRISDDIVISWHLAEQQIKRRRVQTAIRYIQLKYGFMGDALHKGAGLGKKTQNTHRTNYQTAVRLLATN